MSKLTQNKTSVIKSPIIKSPVMFEEYDDNYEKFVDENDKADLESYNQQSSLKFDDNENIYNFKSYDKQEFADKNNKDDLESDNQQSSLKFDDNENIYNFKSYDKQLSTKKSQSQLKLIPDSPVYRNVIVAKLDQLGLDGEEFCNKIMENGCLMAGSFPLQCLLQEFYDDSDIDIFIKYDKNRQNQNNDIFALHHFTKFETWLYSKYGKSEPTKYILYGVLRTHKYFLNNSVKINTIVVDTDDLSNFIANEFDFSFCQTIFDGTKVQCFEMSLKKIGYIVNQNHFKEKKSYHITQQEHDHLIKRRKHPDFVSSSDARIYLDTSSITQQRIEKYQKRGFLILNESMINNKQSINKEQMLLLRLRFIENQNKKLIKELSVLKNENATLQ
jgi:hypothetical protein